jgi:hypothetical protein
MVLARKGCLSTSVHGTFQSNFPLFMQPMFCLALCVPFQVLTFCACKLSCSKFAGLFKFNWSVSSFWPFILPHIVTSMIVGLAMRSLARSDTGKFAAPHMRCLYFLFRARTHAPLNNLIANLQDFCLKNNCKS